MFQEDLAAYTADHLREHIRTYIEAVNDRYTAIDREVVRSKIYIETASLAGGVMSVDLEKLPAYAIDCLDKQAIDVSEDLYTYQYNGHIAGVVIATSQNSADHLVKRHESAVELFVRQHELLHQRSSDYFKILRFFFIGSAFSGAELEGETKRTQNWIAGFRVDVGWITSEDGPVQHVA